ncbi:MAG: sulfite exporter TauE/SafE family protein [Burkholderiales bacterium]
MVLLAAYSLRGSTGFGGAVGMPLLALVIPIKLLVPAWTLLGIASSLTIVGRERRHVSAGTVLSFLPWCAAGVAIGLYFFASLDGRTLARGLGAVVLIYGAHSLWLTFRPAASGSIPGAALAPAASTLAGIVGALFGAMATIFMVVYLDTRRLTKDAFRATISAMLLILSIGRGAGYYAVGEFTRDALVLFAAALPAMLVGMYIGNRVHLTMSEIAFRRLVIAVLLVSGVALLMK